MPSDHLTGWRPVLRPASQIIGSVSQTSTADDRFLLDRWFDWCHVHGLDPVSEMDSVVVETFLAGLETTVCVATGLVVPWT